MDSFDTYSDVADRILDKAEKRHRFANKFNTAVVIWLVAIGLFNIWIGVTTPAPLRFATAALAFTFGYVMFWARKRLDASLQNLRDATEAHKAVIESPAHSAGGATIRDTPRQTGRNL